MGIRNRLIIRGLSKRVNGELRLEFWVALRRLCEKGWRKLNRYGQTEGDRIQAAKSSRSISNPSGAATVAAVILLGVSGLGRLSS